MPDPADPDDLASLGFTVDQLRFLLSLLPGAAADHSARVLQVDPVPPAQEALSAGGAELLARGDLELSEDGSVQPSGEVAAVVYALTRARAWHTVTGATETGVDSAVFVQSDGIGVLAQPRALGTWWFLLIEPSAPADEVVGDLADGYLALSETSAIEVVSSAGGPEVVFTAQRAEGGWGYASGARDAERPEVEAPVATERETRDALRAWVRRIGETGEA